MKFSPTPKNKKPEVAALTLLITTVLLFFFASQYYVKGRALVQALGAFCLAISAYFIIKKLTSYVYTVFPKDAETKKSVSELMPDELTFSVSRRFSSSPEVTRAQLDLEFLDEVVPLPYRMKDKRRIIKDAGKMDLYYYTVTFRPPESNLLIFRYPDRTPTGIVIEADKDLSGFLTEAVRLNREKGKE